MKNSRKRMCCLSFLSLSCLSMPALANYLHGLDGYTTRELLESLVWGAFVCAVIVYCFFKYK